MISSAAYLLFYRRRSNSPLGGPRFKEIIDRFDSPTAPSEDESTSSGEGQRLGADSSHRGSPSALTGAGATRLLGRGSGTGVAAARNQHKVGGNYLNTVKPSEIDNPPDYKTALEDHGTLLESDAVMNDGIEMHDAYDDDEAIDVGSAYGEEFPGTRDMFNQDSSSLTDWNFSALPDAYKNPRTTNSADCDGGSVGGRSDDVQHDSSASEGSMAGRLADFDNAELDDDFVDGSPVPDVEEDQMDFLTLHSDLVGQDAHPSQGYREVKVPPPASDDDREEAAEIHV